MVNGRRTETDLASRSATATVPLRSVTVRRPGVPNPIDPAVIAPAVIERTLICEGQSDRHRSDLQRSNPAANVRKRVVPKEFVRSWSVPNRRDRLSLQAVRRVVLQ